MIVDPKTGYLETLEYKKELHTFTGEKKAKFLELAREAIKKNKNYPPVHELCSVIGINARTFERHVKSDPAFQADWKELLTELRFMFTQSLGTKANSKTGTLANIAMLRFLESGQWNPNLGINPFNSLSPTKELSGKIAEYIDAEVVETPQIPKNDPIERSLNSNSH